MKLMSLIPLNKYTLIECDNYDLQYYIELMIKLDDSHTMQSKLGFNLISPKITIPYVTYAKVIEYVNKNYTQLQT